MVLVVDDHDDMRYVMTAMLQRSGFLSEGVGSGQAALEYIKSHKPACLLLDFNMPIMDGLAVLRTIRADHALDDVRVIMYTATDASILQECLDAGADDFIQKGSMDWDKATAIIERYCRPEDCKLN